jgi:acyl-coenzyme A synthetase/AMP-(fatty) acid ligase
MFLDALLVHASAEPDRPALLAPGRSPVSFRVLSQTTDAIAQTLLTAGVRRGAVVAAALPDGPEHLTAFLGVARVAAFSNLSPSLPASELDQRLVQLRASALITDSTASAAALLARERGVPVWIYQSGELRAEGHTAASRPCVNEDVVLLLQTSATTGKPKIGADFRSEPVRNGGKHRSQSRAG